MLVISKSSTSWLTPGANIDDPRGLFEMHVSKLTLNEHRVSNYYVKKVINAIETVALIFCLLVQF